MADLTANLKATKPTAMQDHKTVTLGQALDTFDSPFKGFVAGLQLEWLSGTSIKVKTGAAVLPGGGLVVVGADITKTGISLGANAWGHVYLYDSGGSAAVEVVTTAPAGYFGSAYQKTGDTTRRYLGSVRTDGSGNILNFLHDGDGMIYQANVGANPLACAQRGQRHLRNHRLLLGGHARHLAAGFRARGQHRLGRRRGLRQLSRFGGAPATGLNFTLAGKERDIRIPLDGSQAFTYAYSAAPTGGSLFVSVLGYRLRR